MMMMMMMMMMMTMTTMAAVHRFCSPFPSNVHHFSGSISISIFLSTLRAPLALE
jgi:hypothetical protein